LLARTKRLLDASRRVGNIGIRSPLPPTTPSVGVAANSGRAEHVQNPSGPAQAAKSHSAPDHHRQEMGPTPADPGELIAASNTVLAPFETFGASVSVDLGRPFSQNASKIEGDH
jgi:hypothetical protein